MAAKALSFDVGDYVVYPKHGVGRVVELQQQEIAGTSLELYVLRFEKERMTLRVPTNKAESVGMRKLSSDKTMREAMETLKGKPRVKRTMWSRRAQEYEAKINSGDLVSIAEVVRDLFRADDQPEQSYSERQIFEAATSRLARELAAMEQVDEPTAQEKILEILRKAAAREIARFDPLDANELISHLISLARSGWEPATHVLSAFVAALGMEAAQIPYAEALRRLARVFDRGSAVKEIERRKNERLKRGELDTRAEAGVVDELAAELIDGKAGFAAQALDGVDDEGGESGDVQHEALVALLTDALSEDPAHIGI